MKKLVFLTVFLLLMTPSSYASLTYPTSPKGTPRISKQYMMPAPTIYTVNGLYQINMTGLSDFDRPGKPILPFKTVSLLLPLDQSFNSVEVIPSQRTEIGNYKINYGRVELPLNWGSDAYVTKKFSNVTTVINQTVYSQNSEYPGVLYSVGSISIFRGYKIIIVNLYPVQYIPSTGEVYYFKSITVNVYTDNVTSIPSTFRGLDTDKADVSSMVSNPEDIVTYNSSYKYVPSKNEFGTASLTPAQWDYVIITSSSLASAFQPLLDYKNSQGIKTTIETVENIYSKYSGKDQQEQIRNFIKDAYTNWGIKYVLLGGDGSGVNVGGESGVNIIPTRYLYPRFSQADDAIPSDIYYSDLEGSFDSNGNGYYGEPGDGCDINPSTCEVDLYADVYVGRATVANVQDVNNFVSKTIAYDSESISDPHKGEALMVGEYLGFGGVANYATNSKEEVRLGSNQNGYTTAGFYPGYSVDLMYDSPAHTWSKDDLISKINNNSANIINHLGHGSTLWVMKLCNAPYSQSGPYCGDSGVTDLSSLSNTKYFFAYSQACYSGAFDNWNYQGMYTMSDSIAEHLVKDAHGAFAVVMNSRYGWGQLFSTDGASERYDRQFFDAIFGQNITELGKANTYSKEKNIGYLSSSDPAEAGVMRYVYYETNLLGDPTTQLQTDYTKPQALITSPQMDDISYGSINVSGYAKAGKAAGSTFRNYKIFYGTGMFPTVWNSTGVTLVNYGLRPVDNNSLGTIDTTLFYDADTDFTGWDYYAYYWGSGAGAYSIKLVVYDNLGASTESITRGVGVHNIVLNQPMPRDVLGPITEIKGTVSSGYANPLTSYSIVYQPQNTTGWSASGITLTNSGTQPVYNGVLGVLNAGGLNTGWYTFRLIAVYTYNTKMQTIENVYIDTTLRPGWPQRVYFQGIDNPYFWTSHIVSSGINISNLKNLSINLSSYGKIAPGGNIVSSVNYPLYNISSLSSGFVSPYQPGNFEPVVSDINGDGKDEIIVFQPGENTASFGQEVPGIISVFSQDGTLLYNWSIPSPTIPPGGLGTPLGGMGSVWLPPFAVAPPSVANIDGDNDEEIVIPVAPAPTEVATLNVYEYNGTLLKTLDSSRDNYDFRNEPLIANLFNNGTMYVVKKVDYCEIEQPQPNVHEWDACLKVYDPQGNMLNGWPVSTKPSAGALIMFGKVNPNQVVGHFENNKNSDIVDFSTVHWNPRGNRDGLKLTVYTPNGTILPGFPVVWDDGLIHTASDPVVGDINRDGKDEIIFVHNGGTLTAVDSNGNTLWTQNFQVQGAGGNTYQYSKSPALIDINHDGYLEIVLVTGSHEYIVDHTGNIIKDFIIAYGVSNMATAQFDDNAAPITEKSPVVVDLNNDGVSDILTTSQNWEAYNGGDFVGFDDIQEIHAFNPLDINNSSCFDSNNVYLCEKKYFPGFPKIMESSIFFYASPVIINKDGKVEIVATSSMDDLFKGRASIYVWDTNITYGPEAASWPMFQHDEMHTGRFVFPLTLVQSVNPASGTAVAPVTPTFICGYYDTNNAPILGASVNVTIDSNIHTATYNSTTGDYRYSGLTLTTATHKWYCSASASGYNTKIGANQTYLFVTPMPVAALKGGPNGQLYVPNITGINYLKVDLWCNMSNTDCQFIGGRQYCGCTRMQCDQTGATAANRPYPTITNWPDGRINLQDTMFENLNFGQNEGMPAWNYTADCIPDRRTNLQDTAGASYRFGAIGGTYSNNTANIKVLFNNDPSFKMPDVYGYIQIPSGAVNFTVYNGTKPVMALVTFYNSSILYQLAPATKPSTQVQTTALMAPTVEMPVGNTWTMAVVLIAIIGLVIGYFILKEILYISVPRKKKRK